MTTFIITILSVYITVYVYMKLIMDKFNAFENPNVENALRDFLKQIV